MPTSSLIKTLQTARLALRPFELSDADFIFALLNTPGWLQFIGDRQIRTQEDARHYLQESIINNFKNNGFGAFAVINQQNERIGMCGLFKRDTLEFPDIGYALLPAFEGKGYAVEAAKAVLQWAQDDLKFTRILAITHPDNVRSSTLLNKIGLVYEQRIRLSADAEELCLFGTT